MDYDKYICISCGNILQVLRGTPKPLFCPICKNKIFQKVSNESNPALRFMVPWDITQYNSEKTRISVKNSALYNLKNKNETIFYF